MRRTIARGVLGSLLVWMGGLVIATIPWSTVLGQHPLLAWVRTFDMARLIALAAVILGLGMLSHSWLALCRYAKHNEGSLPLVLRAAAWWSAPLLLAPPLFSRDGWSYAAQGAMAEMGVSPYSHGPAALGGPFLQAVDPIWQYTATPYGPLPLWWGAMIAHARMTPFGLVLGYRLLAILGLVMLAWAVPRLARWTRADPGLAAALVVASPFVLTNGVAGMHNDLLMAGLMAVALAVATDYWVLGAVLAGLAASVKVPGGLVGVAVALVSLPVGVRLRWRVLRVGLVAVIAVATVLGLGWVTGLGDGWINALGVPGDVNTVLSVTTMTGRGLDWTAGILHLGLPHHGIADVLRALGAVAIPGTAAYLGLKMPTGSRSAGVRTAAYVCLTAALLAESVHLWYLLWALPFIGAARLGRRQMVGLIAASLLGTLFAPLDSSWHAAYVAMIGGAALILALFGLLLLTRTGRRTVSQIAGPHAADRPLVDA